MIKIQHVIIMDLDVVQFYLNMYQLLSSWVKETAICGSTSSLLVAISTTIKKNYLFSMTHSCGWAQHILIIVC